MCFPIVNHQFWRLEPLLLNGAICRLYYKTWLNGEDLNFSACAVSYFFGVLYHHNEHWSSNWTTFNQNWRTWRESNPPCSRDSRTDDPASSMSVNEIAFLVCWINKFLLLLLSQITTTVQSRHSYCYDVKAEVYLHVTRTFVLALNWGMWNVSSPTRIVRGLTSQTSQGLLSWTRSSSDSYPGISPRKCLHFFFIPLRYNKYVTPICRTCYKHVTNGRSCQTSPWHLWHQLPPS